MKGVISDFDINSVFSYYGLTFKLIIILNNTFIVYICVHIVKKYLHVITA